jgi:4a-hydroxytetrahydrobiopterin dehydratase
MNKELNLTQKKCQPCEGIGAPLTASQAEGYLNNVPNWTMNENGKIISRAYAVKNFMTAVNFIHKVAAIAEAEDHHPDIHLTGYRNLSIELTTHALGGLSENDFIVAAKINEIAVELKK